MHFRRYQAFYFAVIFLLFPVLTAIGEDSKPDKLAEPKAAVPEALKPSEKPEEAKATQEQPADTASPGTAVRLPEVVVEGRSDSLTGVASSASQGTVGAKQLSERPVLRGGEVLETVPGVIITQHAGGGKANQYFLRGFNLDHGTDFAMFLDDMPLNLPSHGHGQGYSDMNIVIPELVQRVNYEKGPYDPANGDFSSAGSARLQFFKTLPENLVVVEGGMYGYARTLIAGSTKLHTGNILWGFEATHSDGPWERPDDYKKFNGLLTYSQGDDADGFSITARGYHGDWNSSDQIAASAHRLGIAPFYGSLDDTTGGNSQRYSVQGEWHRQGAGSETKVVAYAFYYDLDLFSNFTYYLQDPLRGDQFEQTDRRWVGGLDAHHTIFSTWGKREVENTFGIQSRSDWIDNGLYQASRGHRTAKVDVTQDNLVLPKTTRADDIWEISTALYFQNKIQWAEKVRTELGGRVDMFHFDVDSNRDANSGEDTAFMGSPKFSLILGPWHDTEIYLQGGMAYHSNDARGVTASIDPVTRDRVEKADPLVRTYGAEVGVRTTAVPRLQSTVSLWWLDIDSELVFVGDAGATEASRPSRRYGIEFANYYDINRHLTIDADFSLSNAEFRDNPRDPDTGRRIGKEIPGSIESVIAAGITYRSDCGFDAGLRLRYFGARPLIEDDSFRSKDTLLLNAVFGYQINDTWKVSTEILNLLDSHDHDIDYEYESRVERFGSVNDEIHFHPVEPFQVRVGVSAKF